MSEIAHGGSIATKGKGFGLYHKWLTREGWLVRKFHELKKMSSRYTPAVIIKGDEQKGAVEVIKAPATHGGKWVLYGNCVVSTDQIKTLDTARVLAGYD